MSYRQPPRHTPQLTCKIDGTVFDTERQLLFYLKQLPTSTQSYYNQYLKTSEEDRCCTCGSQTNFINLQRGYKRYCSYKCSTANPDVIHKRNTNCKSALIKKYGVDNPSKRIGFGDAVKQTKLIRYGNKHYVNADKAKETNLRRYGVTNYTKTAEFKNRIAVISKTKYGVDHFTQSPEIRNKIHQTNLHRYGVQEVFSIIARDKASSIPKMKRLYNYIQTFSTANNLRPDLPSEDVFLKESKLRKYTTECLICHDVFLADWRTVTNKIKCKTCNKPHCISVWEQEVSNFIKTLTDSTVIQTHREYSDNTLYELDIYIPELKIGFECNGIYWHGETAGKKNKDYHINKTVYYQQKNISVFQIWDVEWQHKQEIVKSRISHILHKTPHRVGARTLQPIRLDARSARKFLNETHLGGFVAATHHAGLVDHRGDVYSVMSVNRRGRLGISKHAELLRFSSKLNHNIPGAFSKLFTFITTRVDPGLSDVNVVSYADRRWSPISAGYDHAKFKLVRTTSPSYWYTKSGKLYHRTLFMKHLLKHKLSHFNEQFTESENMLINGYDKLWDCGELVYQRANYGCT